MARLTKVILGLSRGHRVFILMGMLRLTPLIALAILASSLRAAPLPESEQDHLIVHNLARDFLPGSILGQAEIRGEGGTPRGYEEPNVLWVRDRHPLQARDGAGRPVIVSYLNLLNPGGAPYDGSTYVPVAPPAGLPPGSRAYRIGDRLHWMDVRPLPLMIEGGNVIALEKYLIVGQKVIDENARTPQQVLERHAQGSRAQTVREQVRGFVQSGYRARSRDEVLSELARAFEMPVENIVVLPWMPGERTGHIDMYLGAIDGRTLVVPQVDPALIRSLDYEHERTFAIRLSEWLEARLATIQAATRGEVVLERLPMIPPKNLVASGLSEFGWDAQFPTPVNWLLRDGTAYLPSFPEFLHDLPDGAASAFRQSSEERLSRHGYRTEWVPAHRMLPTNGLIHCLTSRLALPAGP